MSPEQRALGGSERCAFHAGRPAVARCDACGRPLCLGCSTPVRGEVLGPDCLARLLGAEDETGEASPVPDRVGAVTRVAFLVAFGATLLPWARSGEGSWGFGAWGTTMKWSLLVAVAATAGVVVSMLGGAPPDPRARQLRWACVVLGLLTSAGSVLAVLRAPAFTDPWFAPWIAAGAGALACVAAVTGAIAHGQPVDDPRRS